jgi:hypothetical protein
VLLELKQKKVEISGWLVDFLFITGNNKYTTTNLAVPC